MTVVTSVSDICIIDNWFDCLHDHPAWVCVKIKKNVPFLGCLVFTDACRTMSLWLRMKMTKMMMTKAMMMMLKVCVHSWVQMDYPFSSFCIEAYYLIRNLEYMVLDSDWSSWIRKWFGVNHIGDVRKKDFGRETPSWFLCYLTRDTFMFLFAFNFIVYFWIYLYLGKM